MAKPGVCSHEFEATFPLIEDAAQFVIDSDNLVRKMYTKPVLELGKITEKNEKFTVSLKYTVIL